MVFYRYWIGLVLLISLVRAGYAQSTVPNEPAVFADKRHYLIDSLNLSNINKRDSALIDSCLNAYHKADTDTGRLNALDYLVTDCWDEEIWPKYNRIMKLLAEEALLKEPSDRSKKRIVSIVATAINNIGFLHLEQGNVPLALELYMESLKMQESIDFKEGIGLQLNNLARIYQNQGEIDKALEFNFRSLKIREEVQDYYGQAMSLNNIGGIYKFRKDYDKALDYFRKSYAKVQLIDDAYGKAMTLNSIAGIFLEVQEYDSALYYFQQSLVMKQELGDKGGISNSQMGIGRVLFEKGQLNEAEKYGISALKIAKEAGFVNDIRDAANLLQEVYRVKKDPGKALEMYDLYIIMRDSVENEQTRKVAVKQSIQYEYDKQKAISDNEHKQQIKIGEEVQKRQQYVIYLVGVITLVIALFAIFVIHRLRITRKQKKIISEQKLMVDEKNEELNQQNEEIIAISEQIEHQNRIVRKQHQDIVDSISYARRIQRAMLPSLAELSGLFKDAFVYYQPKDIVSGDFYWYAQHGDHLLWAVADCTGHGVPGAFMSIIGTNNLNMLLQENEVLSPASALDQLTEMTKKSVSTRADGEEISDGMDIAFCSFNKKTGVLNFSGAYNPLYIVRNNELLEFKGTRKPVGRFNVRIHRPFENHSIQLEPNDVIYTFSDGFADQFGGKDGNKYGYRNFKTFLTNISFEPFDVQQEFIEKEFLKWKGKYDQLDDVCIFGVKVT